MKCIVFLKDGSKHSAWDNEYQANKQIKTLTDYGYKDSYFDFIDHNYENEHYFV